MIKVLIVDDEPLARENLRVFLQQQSDIEIVGECSNAVEGIGAVYAPRRSLPRRLNTLQRYPDAAHQWSGNGGDA